MFNEYLLDRCIEGRGIWECLRWKVDGVEEKMLKVEVGYWFGDDIGVFFFFSEWEIGGGIFWRGKEGSVG